MLGCVATLEMWGGHGEHFYLSCELSPYCSGEEKEVLAPFLSLAGNTPNGRLFGLALSSPSGPTQLSPVLKGEGCASGSWDI